VVKQHSIWAVTGNPLVWVLITPEKDSFEIERFLSYSNRQVAGKNLATLTRARSYITAVTTLSE